MEGTERLTLLDESEVAEWLQVPIKTLRDWRQKRINLPFIPLSGRKVRYDQGAVARFLKGIEVQVADAKKKPGAVTPGQNTNTLEGSHV